MASSELPWAMKWPGIDYPVHPSPLYQAAIDGVLLFILVWLFARKTRPALAVGALFVCLYGCARFITEYFRTPDYEVNLLGITISAGQMLSLPMIVGGLLLLWLAYAGKFEPNSAVKPEPETATSKSTRKNKQKSKLK
jgi:phosphatidylglycerol:prolipoprotein diacylglycerol transferase